jgi:DUF4097 and DUF4098 domain-containing protein YvlB
MAREPTTVPAAPTLSVTTRSGRITVIGEDRSDIQIDRGAPDVTREGDRVVVDGGSSRVDVRCPAGTDLIVGTGSGKVELQGRLGDVRITTGSGRIDVEQVERLDARTGSGKVSVGQCGGTCKCQTGSGSIRVGEAGDAELATGSGRITADLVDAAAVKAGSGSVDVGLRAAGKVGVLAHSGSVTVKVPSGLRPTTHLKARSGHVVCDCEEGNDGEISVTTNSGSISITET